MAAPKDTISTLPHELLGEVFAECASIHPDAPLVLGAVSHLFRHVVYTTPLVWSHLQLGDTDRGRKATLWFEMSKACRVHVQIEIARAPRPEQHSGEPAAVSVPAALETLRFHTDRIASLALRTDCQRQAHAALAAIYSDSKDAALCSLRINAATASASDSVLVFPAIPSITELSTTNVALAALPSLDLAHLQSLRVVQPLVSPPLAADAILALLRVAPSLRRLKLDARIADARPDSPSSSPSQDHDHDTVFLPHLSKLHLRANNLTALLDRLIPPALHLLRLADLDGKRPHASRETGAALHRLLVRMELGRGELHANELRVLEVVGVGVESGDEMWGRCMGRLKALEVFTVDAPGEEEVQDDDLIATLQAAYAEELRTRQEKRPVMAGFGFGFGGDA
ncbi:hypothetical protein C8R47DRAFT_976425 [Mycena vitilis]|nr:hypothetical protein C8R47DRAFT_976425 [Mycena vitilis]